MQAWCKRGPRAPEDSLVSSTNTARPSRWRPSACRAGSSIVGSRPCRKSGNPATLLCHSSPPKRRHASQAAPWFISEIRRRLRVPNLGKEKRRGLLMHGAWHRPALGPTAAAFPTRCGRPRFARSRGESQARALRREGKHTQRPRGPAPCPLDTIERVRDDIRRFCAHRHRARLERPSVPWREPPRPVARGRRAHRGRSLDAPRQILFLSDNRS